MSRLRDLWDRARALGRRETLEREMDEELQFHLDMSVERYVRRGFSREEARRRAMITFGGVERHKEAARSELWSRWLEDLGQDARYAMRTLRHSPRFTIAVLSTLALGMGLTSATFSVVEAVILRPLPYPNPERLVFLGWDYGEKEPKMITALTGYQVAYAREHSKALDGLTTYVPVERDYGEPSEGRTVAGLSVSEDFFRVLGVAPALGRAFSAEENARGEPLVVLGHGFWQRELGGDASVIGRAVRIGTTARTVVGVMPAAFQFPPSPAHIDVLLPLGFTPSAKDEGHNYEALGRIRAAWSRQAVDADLAAVVRSLRTEHPELVESERTRMPQLSFQDAYVGPLAKTLWMLFGAAVFVLLIGCANAANLLLARAVRREREMVLRVALGAERGRVVRLLLMEGIMLSAIACIVGVTLASWGLDTFLALSPRELPTAGAIELNTRVLLLSLGIVAMTGVAFGLAAAIPTMRRDLASVLGQRVAVSSGRARPLDVLVIAETAFAVVLLAGAGLLIASFDNLRTLNPGFSADSVIVTSFGRMPAAYKDSERLYAFQQQLFDEVRRIRGISVVAAATANPLERGQNFPVAIEGRPSQDEGSVEWRAISPGYLDALRVPLRAGRGFTESDVIGGPRVAIVNEAFAKHHFPNESAIGKRVQIGRWKGEWMTPYFASNGTVEIVGVAGDMRERRLDREARRTVLVPLAQWSDALNGRPRLVVRAGASPNVATSIAAAVRSIDASVPRPTFELLSDRLRASIGDQRFQTTTVTLFAATALLLTAIGIFSVLSYTVHQRSREIGVRLALGAQRSSLVRLVVGRGMLLAGAGTGIGVAIALFSSRILSQMLFGVGPKDTGVFGSVIAVLLGVALLAAWLPARRATRIDPVVALRTE